MNVDERISPQYAPRLAPLSYPGWWPRESFILDTKGSSASQTVLYYLRLDSTGSTDTSSFDLDSSHGADGEAAQDTDARGVGIHPGLNPGFSLDNLILVSASTGAAAGRLDEFLAERSLQPMSRRTAVLAVGSNACPPQMVQKFHGSDVSTAIPTLRVRLTGYGVGFMPMISRHGYVPATLIKAPGLKSNVFLQFLDQQQLELLDKSEGVGVQRLRRRAYQRAAIREVMEFIHYPSVGAEPRLEGLIDGADAYVSTIGALAIDSRPVLSDNDQFGVERTEGPAHRVHTDSAGLLVCRNQGELVDALDEDNPSLAHAIRESLSSGLSQSRVKQQAALFASNRIPPGPWPIGNDGVGGNKAKKPDTAREDTKVAQAGESPTDTDKFNGWTVLTVRPSGNGLRRDGESCVVLSKKVHTDLDKPRQVVLQNNAPTRESRPAPRAIARVVPPEFADVAEDDIHVDQVLRDAIFAGPGDEVALAPLTETSVLKRVSRRLVLTVFGRPNFVTARVQAADITTMERDVALVTPLTLQMLGIDPGEFAVLEGVTPQGTLRTQSVRVFPLDELTLQLRMERQEGSKTPEPKPKGGKLQGALPPLYIDAAIRERLLGEKRLPGKKSSAGVGVIRMRASVAEQVQKELREFFLILLLSILTWVLASPGGDLSLSSTAASALVAVVCLAGILLIGRIRWRYKHTAPSRFTRRRPGSSNKESL